MAISCDCSYDYAGIVTVGDPKEVVCRTPRRCSSCHKQIKILDKMYCWSCYNYDEYLTVAPHWMCEECGDMALNLMELDFCFSLEESIRQQWLDYLYDVEPNNPAVKNEKEKKHEYFKNKHKHTSIS